MCRLIASEELWTLLDALQEHVPDEVYQHLDSLSTTSPQLLVSARVWLSAWGCGHAPVCVRTFTGSDQ